MKTCPACGQEMPLEAGDFTITEGPMAVHWRGRRLALPSAQIKMLAALIRRGKVSYVALADLVLGSEAGPENLRVVLFHLRRRLREQGVVAEIRVEYGWGLHLVIPPTGA